MAARAVTFPLGAARGIGYRDARGREWFQRVSGRLVSDGRRLYVVPRTRGRRIARPAGAGELEDLAQAFGDNERTQEYTIRPTGRRRRLGRVLLMRYRDRAGVTWDHLFDTPPIVDRWATRGGDFYRVHGGNFAVGPFGIEG